MADIQTLYQKLVEGGADDLPIASQARPLQRLAMERAQTGDVGERIGALRVAAALGRAHGLSITRELLADPDPKVRRFAFNQAVAARRAGIGLLRLAAGGPDAELAAEALRLLSLVLDRGAVPIARRLTGHASSDVRAQAAALLGRMAGPGAKVELNRLASDPEETVRDAAGRALEQLDGGAEAPRPDQWWDDDQPSELPAPPTTAELHRTGEADEPPRQADDAEEREAPAQEQPPREPASRKAQAPKETAKKPAVKKTTAKKTTAKKPAAKKAAAKKAAAKKAAAKKATAKKPAAKKASAPVPADPPEPTPSPTAADHALVPAGATALAAPDSERSTPPPGPSEGGGIPLPSPLPTEPRALLRLLGQVTPTDQRPVLDALAPQTDGVMKHLASYRPGGDPALGRGLALATAQVGRGSWLIRLRPLLADPSPGVRAAVASAFGVHGGGAAIPQVTRLLQDADPEVRCHAVESLVQLCTRADRPEILRQWVRPLVDDAAPTVRAAARRALELPSDSKGGPS